MAGARSSGNIGPWFSLGAGAYPGAAEAEEEWAATLATVARRIKVGARAGISEKGEMPMVMGNLR